MRRRKFITLLGGAAVWPIAAQAEKGERTRLLGVLMGAAADNREALARLEAFVQELRELGWTDSRNLRIEVRWDAGNLASMRRSASRLLALAPDLVLAGTSPAVESLKNAKRSVPVVFVSVIDPVGAGHVTSLAQPGGKTTGFIQFEHGIGGAWVELLKQIAPGVTRVAVIHDPAIPSERGLFAAAQKAASSLGVAVTTMDVRETGDLEQAITAFARSPNGGLVVTGNASSFLQRNTIVMTADRLKLPTIYSARYFVTEGGLISYAADQLDQYRRAAGYVDRILKGENPSNLPVQMPAKFEMVVNLKAAKLIGLALPQSVLSRASEVIE